VFRSVKDQERKLVRGHPWILAGSGPLELGVAGNDKGHDLLRKK